MTSARRSSRGRRVLPLFDCEYEMLAVMSPATRQDQATPGRKPKTLEPVKLGRPAKTPGDPRPGRTVRFPTPHRQLYEREADELGISYSSYVVLLAARGRGLPDPDYILEDIEQAKEKAKEDATRKSRQEPLDPSLDDGFTAGLLEAS